MVVVVVVGGGGGGMGVNRLHRLNSSAFHITLLYEMAPLYIPTLETCTKFIKVVPTGNEQLLFAENVDTKITPINPATEILLLGPEGAELRFRLRFFFFLFLVVSRCDAHASRRARNKD